MDGARVQGAHNLYTGVEVVQVATVGGRPYPKLDDAGAIFCTASVHYSVADDGGHVIEARDESHDSGGSFLFVFLRPLTTHEFTIKERGKHSQ